LVLMIMETTVENLALGNDTKFKLRTTLGVSIGVPLYPVFKIRLHVHSSCKH
jgi:hypothetical protein